MSLSVAIFRIEGADVPPLCSSTVEAGLMVSELERRGHAVHPWRVHFHYLESLAEELSQQGCELFVIEALAPLDVLHRLPSRIENRPCALFGPPALALFEQTQIPFALVGTPRQTVGELADHLARLRDGPRGTLPELDGSWRKIPNLFARMTATRAPDNDADDAVRIEVSSQWRSWSYETELLPFASRAAWSYRGPSRDEKADLVCPPLLAERGCVHAPSSSGAEAKGFVAPTTNAFVRDEGDVLDADTRMGLLGTDSWSAPAWNRIVTLYSRPQVCPFGICSNSGAIPLEQVLVQADQFWGQGVRSFELRAPNPFPIAVRLLDDLAKADRAPELFRLRPSAPALRQSEPILRHLLQAHPQVRFELCGIEFFLAGRSLGQPRFDTSQWEARSIARFLQRLGDRAPNLDATSQHQLVLFDPYSTLEEILDTLQVIEEDAPFLKGALSAEAPLLIASPYSPIARQLQQDGLLSLDGPFGIGVRFRSEEIPLYRDLVARGLAPLLEAVGRLRLPPKERDRLALEGRFRWFRELARFVISRRGGDRSPTDGWGQVLAAVTGDLGLDQVRPR